MSIILLGPKGRMTEKNWKDHCQRSIGYVPLPKVQLSKKALAALGFTAAAGIKPLASILNATNVELLEEA